MEVKYQYILLIGVVVLVVLIFANWTKIKSYEGGKKIASMYGLEKSPYYKRKLRNYKILRWVAGISSIATIALSFFLLARPYTTEKIKEDQYKRDIILCFDVSTSVNELNESLVEKLKDSVGKLKGERFGIVIFNTSGALLCPLTDDYEYVISILDQMHSALAEQDASSDSWIYNERFLMEGTLVGNEQRGSSLVGDGLATAVGDFPEMDKERTRIVILSTDNDVEGEPIFTLDQAADLCKKNKVTVYGVGTKLMMDDCRLDMKSAVEKTGGKFYEEEDSGTVDSIVENIDASAKSLTKGKVIVREIPIIKVPMILLCISFLIQIVSVKLLKM